MSLHLRAFTAGCFVWLATCPLLAQNTNYPSLGFRIAPTNLSYFISESTNAVAVTLTNWAQITNVFTNITVVGTFGAQTNIKFLDNGVLPDKGTNDGSFSANLITPYVTVAKIQTLNLVISADVQPTEPPTDPPPPPVKETNTVDYWILPRPANDKFTNAFKIARDGELIVATNNFASIENFEPQHAQVASVSASVWWYWGCPYDTNVLVDLGGSSFDAVLAIYTGTSLTNLVPVAAATNDVVNKLKAHVNFDARAGDTYRLAISGYNTNDMGNVRLRVQPGALPDTSGPVVSIASPAGEAMVTNALVAFTGTAKERQPNESGVSKVILQVNTDTNLVTASGTTAWSAVVTLPVGTNLVRAYGIDYDGNRGPSASVVVRYINPVNDMFANAIELTGVGNVVSVDNTYATKEPGEPLHAKNGGGRSVWYLWRAPFTGDLSLNTQGSTVDTVLALYIGDSVSNLVEVASNDDAAPKSGYSSLTQRVVADQLYYIAVDGFGGATGTLMLTYSFTTTSAFFQLSVASPLGGTVLPPNNLYEAGTVVRLSAIADKNFAFVRWEDPSRTWVSTDNPLTLVMNQNYSLEAKFRLLAYTDSFSSGDFSRLPWMTAGSAPWSVNTYGGGYAARSGVIGDGQSSSLILITNLYAGTGSFDLQTSSETGGDWLEFYLNGSRLNRWSGALPWQTFQFPVPAGLNTLEWRYVKDANYSSGLDAAFIDNVYVPLDKPNPPSSGPLLSLNQLNLGQMQLTVQGQANVTYWVQTSTNLLTWERVFTNRSSSFSFQWIDPKSSTLPRRYYRVVAP